ncbi:MBL fold metallo-hydrolase [Roseomonas sp. E05]|uniref:MBL fold metallo-hydrolase n=1 Tax=Roseomonas sp. E05 TaxID=3046310 RepID=UPI0024B9ABA9|nr:MBL fold metallo-hydrolase [Roseomonas sp. E05]MDJ0390527.1 MBL fold metallo-hydrolase [Roseomonas sp. E05]
MSKPVIRAFFDEPTNTVSYLIWDPTTREGAVIDPVLDWDNRSGEADIRSADAILGAAAEAGVTVRWVLETHAHADHLTAAPYIKARTGAPIGIGEHIKDVQRIFRPVFHAEDLRPGGGDFDRLFRDGERFPLGRLTVEVLHVPGHTPADVAYRVLAADAAPDEASDVFVGDTLFMHDYGTARADFPGGDARALYRSIQRLLALPPQTRLWMCHDYKAPGRDHYAWQSSVAEQRAHNPHVKDGSTEEDFVRFRTERDSKLAAPALLLPSIQVNIRAGRFPEAESNGVRYLVIPVTARNGAVNLPEAKAAS